MARLPRYALPGQPQHVIQRGNNRSLIFGAAADYNRYLEHVADACRRHRCLLHAYVLMTNHVHLLITQERAEGIGKVLQSIGRHYVQYFNVRYQRTGTLWEGRYRATPIDTERYLLTCYRYIELNPVRAGLVVDPGDYAWSSYRANALGQPDPLVTPHVCFQALGTTTRERLAAYRALFCFTIDTTTLQAIRDATHTGWALGDDSFRAELRARGERRSQRLPPGRRPRTARGIRV